MNIAKKWILATVLAGYQQIVAHPEVFRPKLGMKELHFFHAKAFRELTQRDIQRYHRLFPRPRGAITGEWTPGYMADPAAAQAGGAGRPRARDPSRPHREIPVRGHPQPPVSAQGRAAP